MSKRFFEVTVTVNAVVELDDAVIDAVDDSWREQFYDDIETPEDIAHHVGGNMIHNGLTLRQIDGFAHLTNEAARVLAEDWEAEAKEIKKPKARRRHG